MRHQKEAISDSDFIEFKKGKHLVFQIIFEAYHKSLYHYVLGFVRKADEAEELVQEAFVNLFVSRSNLRDAAGIYPFLFTVTKRLMISGFRKKMVRMKYEEYFTNHWREDCWQTENHLKARELEVLLDDAIDELPERQKEIYTLSKFDELSYQDIADVLGLSKNTVKNHLIAASRRIKDKIEKAY